MTFFDRELEKNYLTCKKDKNGIPPQVADSCDQSEQMSLKSKDVALAGSLIALFACVLSFIWLFMIERSKRKYETQAEYYTLSEMDLNDEHFSLKVTPSVLKFGSESMQVPVYKEVNDVLFVKGVHGKTAFRLVLPTVPAYKCVIDAALTQGIVGKDEELGIEFGLTMMCTTKIDIPLLVVTDSGYATVRIKAESQLSTRLDADEVAVGKVIGVGGYGTVYRGEWRGVDVAIKEYNQTILADFATRKDFEREVEMCFKLRMPYIVSFYGKTVSPEKTYIVMEYVPHGSLSKLLGKRTFSLRYKVRLALDIARGMNYLHKNRIIHRDLKADNVLVASVDPDSSVCAKLSDFNTSRFIGDDIGAKTKGIGTPIYMAPEIHDGKPYNGSADVYSFAMTIWAIWAQKEPYSELTSSLELYRLIINGERLEIPEGIPDQLGQLTRMCWDQDPDKRPAFAGIVKALDEYFASMAE